MSALDCDESERDGFPSGVNIKEVTILIETCTFVIAGKDRITKRVVVFRKNALSVKRMFTVVVTTLYYNRNRRGSFVLILQ